MPRNSNGGVACGVCLFFAWIMVNALDAVWLYFFVRACVDPNPRNAVNRTHSGFQGYEAMMFLFGFVWGVVNLCAAWAYYAWLFGSGSSRGRFLTTMNVLANIFIVLPFWATLIIMPFFGGWIVVPIAQRVAWNHRCDSYPMYAVLDGRSYSNPRYTPNVVHFYQTGTNLYMYTYAISDSEDSDIWGFNLREWDMDQSQIPLELYPTLQQISYNFLNTTVSGNCTTPVAPGSSNTNITSCLSGTFNPDNYLSFSLTSKIPLNTTTTNETSSLPSVTTQLRIIDKEWAFTDDAPSLILKRVDPATDQYQEIVLRTAVTHPSDCTRLKVCINGVSGRQGGPVGAEIMAPMGLIMLRQADYAIECTTPSDS